MGQDKQLRILDAAEALLVNFGYRKVTMDDVARRACVGKGTMYLSWPSKQELFAAVITREAATLLNKQLAALHADPAEAQLHRTWRRSLVEVMHRPLAKALYTGDSAVLGELLATTTIGALFTAGKADRTARHLAMLYKHGLLVDDPVADPMLPYRVSATVTGFFLLGDLPRTADIDPVARADALATTLRRAFEPHTEPTAARLHDVAADLTELYEQWLADLTASLPGTQT